MASKPPPIPKVVPIPDGYRRAKQEEITPEVLTFARLALEHALPIGKQQLTIAIGPTSTKKGSPNGQRSVMAMTEWHYDNHPSGGKGPPYWHPGISILVPKTDKAPQTKLAAKGTFPTSAASDRTQGLPKSKNEFAGDPCTCGNCGGPLVTSNGQTCPYCHVQIAGDDDINGFMSLG